MNTKQLKTIADKHFRLIRKPRIEILGYILFTDGRAIFTDLETWIEHPIDIVGTYCYHRDDIKSLCIEYPNTDVEFTERGIILPNGNIFKSIVIDPQDFPKTPDVPFRGLLLTPYTQAKLRELAPMVDTDKLFPVLHMQHIYIDKGTAVAANSNSMGWRDELGLGEMTGFIPPHFFSYMDKEAEYSILFNSYKVDEYNVSGWVHVWNRDISLKWQYIGRKFPNWKSVIPDYKEATNIYIPTETLEKFLKKALDLSKIHKQDFNFIKIEPKGLRWENKDFEQVLFKPIELGEFAVFALDIKLLLKLLDTRVHSTLLKYIGSKFAVEVNENNIIMPLNLDKLK